MSDTDSDVTIEPDPSDWDLCPNLKIPTNSSLSKRQKSYHNMSDSEEEEPSLKLPAAIQRQNTEDSHSGRSSPRLLKKIKRSPLSKTLISNSLQGEKSAVLDSESDLNNSARSKKSSESKSVPRKESRDSPALKRKHSSGDSPKRSPSAKSSEVLPLCRYGSKCYRKNPEHFKEFSHICMYNKFNNTCMICVRIYNKILFMDLSF